MECEKKRLMRMSLRFSFLMSVIRRMGLPLTKIGDTQGGVWFVPEGGVDRVGVGRGNIRNSSGHVKLKMSDMHPSKYVY